MANPNQSEKSNALDREENITKGNLSAKRVALYTYDSGSDTLQPYSGGGGGGAGDASSANQLIGIDVLNQMQSALASIAGAKGVLSDIRTTVINTVPVSGTLTGVTTVTNQAQMGGYLSNNQIPALMNMASVQSNINNVIVS